MQCNNQVVSCALLCPSCFLLVCCAAKTDWSRNSMIHSCCPGPLPAERTNKRGSSGVAVECRCVLSNAIRRNPLNTALSIRSSFGFCISYRILNVAQNLSAIFICPRTELCSLALKLSSLKQTFFPIISVFVKLATEEKVISWTLALQLHVSEPYRLTLKAIQSFASIISGWLPHECKAGKSHLSQPHSSTCWVQGWTFALTGHTLPVVSTLSMLH